MTGKNTAATLLSVDLQNSDMLVKHLSDDGYLDAGTISIKKVTQINGAAC